MYLVIFPEGTRYNPELKNVIAESQAFAAKEGSCSLLLLISCILIQLNKSEPPESFLCNLWENRVLFLSSF